MNTFEDQRVVLSLDAGGTNLVFSAIQGNQEIVEPVKLASNAHDLVVLVYPLQKNWLPNLSILNSLSLSLLIPEMGLSHLVLRPNHVYYYK